MNFVVTVTSQDDTATKGYEGDTQGVRLRADGIGGVLIVKREDMAGATDEQGQGRPCRARGAASTFFAVFFSRKVTIITI